MTPTPLNGLVKRLPLILASLVILLGGMSVAGYLFFRGQRADAVCTSVNKIHDVLENLLEQSEKTSQQNLDPDRGITQEELDHYYSRLFKTLEPVDVDC